MGTDGKSRKQQVIILILFLVMVITFFGMCGFWGWNGSRLTDACFLLFFFSGLGICNLLFRWKSSMVKVWSVIHGLICIFWMGAPIFDVTDKRERAAVLMGTLILIDGAIMNVLGLHREKIWARVREWIKEHWHKSELEK